TDGVGPASKWAPKGNGVAIRPLLRHALGFLLRGLPQQAQVTSGGPLRMGPCTVSGKLPKGLKNPKPN
ncbi:hypothetical protein Ancab_038343, partial [Ancistrocladus abbreviatus]